MIKISACHSSKGRPEKAMQSMQNWLAAADRPEEVEYLFALEDFELDLYAKLLPSGTRFARVEMFGQVDGDIVKAGNMIITKTSPTAEFFACPHDDLDPCDHWDTELRKLFDGDNFTEPRLVHVSDGIHPHEKSMIMFINRAMYTKNGWVVWPGYTGCFSDNDLLAVATRLGAVVEAPQLVYHHRHYSAGEAEYDATYASHNNDKDYYHNREIFRARQARNFDL